VSLSLYVCLSVCLSLRSISTEPHAQFYQIFVHFAYSRDSVLLQQGDAIPREGAILGFFFADNSLYNIAFGTHTKMAEPIEMQFGSLA